MTTDSVHPSSPRAGGPLAGLRVIETGVLLAGPFCARLLADFGAEVYGTMLGLNAEEIEALTARGVI